MATATEETTQGEFAYFKPAPTSPYRRHLATTLDFLIERKEAEVVRAIARERTEIKGEIVGLAVSWLNLAEMVHEFCQNPEVESEIRYKREALRLINQCKAVGHRILNLSPVVSTVLKDALEMNVADFQAVIEGLHMEEKSIAEEITPEIEEDLIALFPPERSSEA